MSRILLYYVYLLFFFSNQYVQRGYIWTEGFLDKRGRCSGSDACLDMWPFVKTPLLKLWKLQRKYKTASKVYSSVQFSVPKSWLCSLFTQNLKKITGDNQLSTNSIAVAIRLLTNYKLLQLTGLLSNDRALQVRTDTLWLIEYALNKKKHVRKNLIHRYHLWKSVRSPTAFEITSAEKWRKSSADVRSSHFSSIRH